MRFCKVCSTDKPVEDFQLRFDRKEGDRHTTCKDCRNDQTRNKRTAFKQMCVDYKGGCCVNCGYSRCLEALEFHHIDPSQKDFSLSKKKVFSDTVRQELDKCILVCANCHREIHSELFN